MLPSAINAININDDIKIKKGDAKKEEQKKDIGKIKGIYESYLCQFGPMVIQLGLRSTLAVYQNKSGGSKGDRKCILDLIWTVLKEPNYLNLTDDKVNSRDKWITKLISNPEEIDLNDEQLILDASVSLKRAIRTFSLTDDKNN